jgi:hypothetical protein
MYQSFVLNGIQIELCSGTVGWLVTVVESRPDHTLVYHTPSTYCELLVLLRLTCKRVETIQVTNDSVNDVISIILNNKNLSLKANATL